MSRSVPEWIGKTDDTPVPPHVRLRVFDRFKGICGICTVKIRAKRWTCDHRVALCNGGENRESNLWPIHEACDRSVKTPADVALRAANDKVRMRHLGIKKRKRRPMPGSRDSGIKMKIGGGWERR
ncbi:HNH endonuclease signature motif containing protein [Bradyrhizobium sp. BRP23]|uniref:HNH endonuclease n=1 Tax=Bradyrhizobium sp. BRP23 TaxID=2793820 RepID=UPI001CD310C5|nr:HNH endonuclease signature motif containing protein [Bradyrhizobium sp. BRP23]MCA1419444.1 HNH endonuclease [Bradyrhizobium sp. BRP23]